MKNSTKIARHLRLPLGAALAMSLLLTGCEREDWTSPEYVAQMLVEGDDRQKREAVAAVRGFPDEARAELAGPMAQVYLENPSLREDVMRQLIQWREPGAVAAYVEEMKENHTGTAEHAGETLGTIQSRESIPAMVETFGAIGNDERRDGILRGLKQMPDPSVVEIGLEVLALDPDNHRISMHSHTCDLFGELALSHPDAITDDVVKAIVRAVFLSDEVGRVIGNECRVALQKIGEPAVPHLIELFNEENEEVSRLLMTYERSTEGYQYPMNRAKQEAAVMLSTLRTTQAVEPFLEDMAEEKSAPEGFTGQRRLSWIRMEGASLSEMIFGLGDIGDPAARPALEAALRGEQANNQWSEITDDMVEFEFKQNAARALAQLGDRDARPALMAAARADIEPRIGRRFEVMARRAEEAGQAAMAQDEMYRPQWQAARAFAYLAEAGDRAAFQELVDSLEEGAFRTKVASHLPAFDVLDECQQEDDAERARCFGGFLSHAEEAARFKAAYELGQLPAEAAAPVIAENLSHRDLATREVITFAGYRSPSMEVAEAARAQREADASRSAAEYRSDRIRLTMLEAWIKRSATE